MHREVLTDAGAALFPSLARFRGFYLAGGTALALQIGHRLSVDYDLFSAADIDRRMLDRTRRVFGDAVKIVPLVNNSGELTVLVNGVKITFLRYPFRVLAPFVMYETVPLLSVREIAATKVYTIGRRGSFKDYVDLYFVLAEQHATLASIIADAEEKFGSDFNSRLFLEQLVYLADLDDGEVQFIKPITSPREVQTFFEDRIRELGDAL
jgi:predicted nucleotidyltransferase component of viral defense system